MSLLVKNPVEAVDDPRIGAFAFVVEHMDADDVGIGATDIGDCR